ncbi:MAG: prolyl oligopeptidase family serine peptidase [Planctomycetota bacterium]
MQRGRAFSTTLVLVAGSSLLPAQVVPYPSLAEIFAARPPFGFPPKDLHLSSDGKWLLLHTVPAESESRGNTKATPATSPYVLTLLETRSGNEIPIPVRKPGRAAFGGSGHRLLFVKKRELFVMDSAASAPSRLLGESDAKKPFERIRRLGDGSLYFKAGDRHWILERNRKIPQSIALPAGSILLAHSKKQHRCLFRTREAVNPEGEPSDCQGERQESSNSDEPELVTLGWTDGRRVRNFVVPAKLDKVAFGPDGSMAAIAVLHLPERGPHQLVPDFLEKEVGFSKARNSRIDDLPAVSRLRLVRIRPKNVEPIELPLDLELPAGSASERVLSLEFDSRGKRLLVQTLGSDYHRRRLLVFERKMRKPRLLHEEDDPAWIGPLARRAFFDGPGKTVLFSSETDGRAALFRVPVSGGRPERLTPKGIELQSLRVSGDRLRLLLGLGEPDVTRRSIHVLDLERNQLDRAPQPLGWNTEARISDSGRRLVYLHAESFRPAEVHVADPARRDLEPRKITSLTPASFLSFPWIRPRTVRYTNAEDGARVWAQLFRPPGQPPAGGWPAVIFLHGAGYLQNVSDSMTAYKVNLLFHHRLAARGFVVLNPDYRGSRGYGRKFRTDVYKDLGGPDRADVIAARAFLVRAAGVDPDRIGIYGGSYGGFLTLMCLFKDPEAFACGAALRPVTDWSRYHPNYTHPRLGRPRDPGGQEVYRKTSPIHFARGLVRPLLLLHGMGDTNVFVQDTIRLTERLIRLGKDFDTMLYPSQKHTFADPSAWVDEYRRIERLFDRVLEP